LNINHACRKAGIGITTYYRWKALQENPVSNEQFRISELEAEVDRLKLPVVDGLTPHNPSKALMHIKDRAPNQQTAHPGPR
jgi:hypothetical protein